MDRIYLDNAATTMAAPEVCAAVEAAMCEFYGNPSSLHGMGVEAERAVNAARAAIAGTMSVAPERIVFTSGGTEANNMSILGVCRRKFHGRNARALTTAAEHPSVLQPYKEVAAGGISVDFAPVDSRGLIDPAALDALLDNSVALISVTHVNNETGIVQPVADIAKLRDRKCPQALLHVDCVQSFGKLDFSPAKAGADLVSVSAHKIHGPKGIGALYISERAKIVPMLFGGGQEFGLRPGTENTPAAAGFAAAVRTAFSSLKANASHVSELKRLLLAGLERSGVGYVLISDDEQCSPYILSVSFPGIRAELMLNKLSGAGIYVSSGAACSSKRAIKTGSHVLAAMGLKQGVADGAIRFSFSRYNTAPEIETVLEVLTALKF